MTAALIIVLLLAVASLIATNRRQPWGRPALLVSTVLALGLGSWSLLARGTKSDSTRQAIDVQTEAGRVLAEQVLTQVEAGRILVLTYAPVRGERRFTDLRLRGFTNALAGKAIEVVLAGPNMSQSGTPDSSFLSWPLDVLGAPVQDWLGKNPDAKAVVSLMPYPPRDLSTREVPLYAFAVFEMPEWQAGVRAGKTKAVLVTRPTIMQADPAMPTKQVWSDLFELVTPQNIADYKTPAAY